MVIFITWIAFIAPHCFRTKNQLKSHEKLCKNKDFCGIVMPTEKENILECTFNIWCQIKCQTFCMLTLNL